MKKHSVVAKKYPIVPKSPLVETTRRSLREPQEHSTQPAPLSLWPFLTLRYSYTEITASGGTARLKSRRARYDNGRLESESFEGEIDRGEYERRMDEARREFAAQAAAMLRPLFSLFPFLGKPR